MIEKHLSVTLPTPWVNEVFESNQIGEINFIVGPNGSGKSRFARELVKHLDKARLLGTDRLNGMEQYRPFDRFVGDPFREGLAKNQFSHLREAGTAGSGMDTFVLLEERMDLRIQVEATLSHLFDREIMLEWDSGNLIAKARRVGESTSYRLDREECHGIKELLVLLTHLYDDQHNYLIIDEPELNLHPQYQAFFMDEVRKVAGDPTLDGTRKAFFLITHSPSILDFRTADDLRSTISFNLGYSIPKHVANMALGNQIPLSFTRRLNAHHKQLFFSDNPVFVEGILDAQLITAMMDALGVSSASAGSCIIDAGGSEEVNRYLELCNGLGKEAHFLYDIDSLFSGNLRACITQDETIQSFLATAGLGNSFGRYCGQLDHELTLLIDAILSGSLPASLRPLHSFLDGLGVRNDWQKVHWARARTAVITAISRHREDCITVASLSTIEGIEGRRDQILAALAQKNIHVLPGGTLERYLPHYRGNEYELASDAKREAVYAEIEEMASLAADQFSSRYGDLHTTILHLPSKTEVDVDVVLRSHLSQYIYHLQQTVLNHPDWQTQQIQHRLHAIEASWDRVFSIEEFHRTHDGGFSATICVIGMLGKPRRIVRITQQTNAGMSDFEIEPARVMVQ